MAKQRFYDSSEWQKLRLKVLRRDNYTCRECGQLCLGKKRNGHSPVVDHIQTVKEHPELATNLDNLRVLCKTCDNKRHREKGRNGKPEPEQIYGDGFPADSDWR